jgi:hypothetical protein
MIRCLAATGLSCLLMSASTAHADCTALLSVHDVQISIEPDTDCLEIEVVNLGCSIEVAIANECAEELVVTEGLACAGVSCVIAPGETARDGVDTGAGSETRIDRTYRGTFPEGEVAIDVSFGATRPPAEDHSGCSAEEARGNASPPPFELACAIPWLFLLRSRGRRPPPKTRAGC